MGAVFLFPIIPAIGLVIHETLRRLGYVGGPTLIALAGWLFLFGTAGTTLKNYGALALALGAAVFLLWSWQTRRWPFVPPLKKGGGGAKADH